VLHTRRVSHRSGRFDRDHFEATRREPRGIAPRTSTDIEREAVFSLWKQAQEILVKCLGINLLLQRSQLGRSGVVEFEDMYHDIGALQCTNEDMAARSGQEEGVVVPAQELRARPRSRVVRIANRSALKLIVMPPIVELGPDARALRIRLVSPTRPSPKISR
jgi:hypothetical protein